VNVPASARVNVPASAPVNVLANAQSTRNEDVANI
jgi:hypothetical protein